MEVPPPQTLVLLQATKLFSSLLISMTDKKHLGSFPLILHLHFCLSVELLEERDSV